MIRTEIWWKARVLCGGLRFGKKLRAGARVRVSDRILYPIPKYCSTEMLRLYSNYTYSKNNGGSIKMESLMHRKFSGCEDGKMYKNPNFT